MWCGVCVYLSPPLRRSLIAIEPVVPCILLAVALVLGVGQRLARLTRCKRVGRSLKRAERHLGRGLACWGLVPVVLLFLLPIWAHRAGYPPDRYASFRALLGHIPWSDAHYHAEGGYRLMAEGSFGPYSEQRPLNAAWLGVRLALFKGRLDPALELQAARRLSGV